MKFSDIREVKNIFNEYASEFKYVIFAIFLIQILAALIMGLQPMILAGVVETITNNFQIQNIKHDSSDQGIGSFFNLNLVGFKIRELINTFFALNPDNPIIAISILLSIYIITVIFSSLINYFGVMLGMSVRFKTSVVIREKMMAHIFNLSVPFLNKSKSGEIISRFVNDAENTAHGVGPLFSAFFTNTSLLLIYGTFLVSTNYTIALGGMVFFFIQYLLIIIVRKPLRHKDSKVYDTKASLSASIQEIFTNLRYIKIFNAEEYQKKEFKKNLVDIQKSELSVTILKNALIPIKQIIDNLAIVGIVILVSYFIFTSQITVTAGVIYIVIGRLIIPPINSFTVLFIWLQGVLAANQKVQMIMDEKINIGNGSKKITNFDKIKFNNINFSYQNEQKILKNISFEIDKGEKVALVGPSGSGKSTLIDLLIRFYDPSSGSIEIDGTNLKDIEINSYRKIFGVVSQETILFNDTIENNISLGRKIDDSENIKMACDLANASEFIEKFPDKFQTNTGDRGVKLSGGQKQRISIARALLCNPKIIVFDEATSNLDSQSEHLVQESIENALKNITGLVIAHRLSTIIKADKIIFLNNGRIEAMGKHSVLMKENEIYRAMYNQQVSSDKS